MAEERVALGVTDIVNITKHIARYNLSLLFARGKNILDVACGTGYGTFLLSNEAKFVMGVDIDPTTIIEANKNFKRSNNLFIYDNILNLKRIKRKFDVIVTFETLEHIYDINEAEDIIDYLLVDGGLVIYSLPLNEKKGQNEYHFHTFTELEANDLFPKYSVLHKAFQKGVNFYPTIQKGKQYFFCVKCKENRQFKP